MLAPIKDLFFRRMKFLKGDYPDFYSYTLNKNIRHKIIGTILDFNYVSRDRSLGDNYNELDELVISIERELGKNISSEHYSDKKIQEFLFNCADEEFLSTIEILISIKVAFLQNFHDDWHNPQNLRQRLSELIDKINSFFKINKLGYEIVPAGLDKLPFIVVPFNSKYLHLETINLPMELMYAEQFEGALNEFQKSLDKFRKNDFEGAIIEANKSYESTLKTILQLRKLSFDEKKEDIPHLIDKISTARLFDVTLESTFKSFWPILKNGPNNIRNLSGIAHGQGKDVKKLQKTYADFVMRTVGTYTVFLIERYQETK